MDVQSGESEKEEVKGKGISESEMEKLVPNFVLLKRYFRQCVKARRSSVPPASY